MAGPSLDQRPDSAVDQRTATDTPWQVVVWDDPVNLMSWVTWVFRTHFGFPQAKSHRLMLEVHTNGRAVVASGSLEQAEQHVAALHGYGLWATYERTGGSGDPTGDSHPTGGSF
ncbi:MAG: ATP-dependent Clp protease adapter ClpS [Kocuria sp.]|nr:ATP-dependent Clp protease adapter ClpS [Kocuria sp.]MDO5618362.1 ATP-dependent Clp protease adapter ClpS [Kocuria sp.]